MRRLYNALFGLGFCLSAPYYFLKMWRRGGWREGFEQRFGRYDSRLKQALTNRDVLWFHAVSVGEVNLCTQLIAALEPRVPNAKMVVSTTTSTGMAELKRKLPTRIEKIYYPLDFERAVSRALQIIHPEAVILIEAEIWPNFIHRLRARQIPVFLVNGRLSESSYRGYRRFGALFRELFATFAAVGAQDEADAERFRELGCRREAVHAVGSLKFDAARLPETRPLDVLAMFAQLGVVTSAPVIVAGSTHGGEEALLAAICRRLRAKHPDLFLVLVPRHFERGKEIGRELKGQGVSYVYRSTVTPATRRRRGEVHCLLVNTTGELRSFYEQATVVFVGKSLTAHGGQNPIEPGALGKAMIFGPHMENFKAISAAFVEAGAAVQIQSAAQLEDVLDALLSDVDRRRRLGERALQVVRERRGAIERTVDLIVPHLHKEGLYVAPQRALS